MSIYRTLKQFVPLRIKVAARSLLARRPFTERRACLQLHQPLLSAPHPAFSRVRVGDFELYTPSTGFIGSQLAGGTWEPHITQTVRSTLKEGDTFLDVGANVGYFTLLASRLVGPSGHVLAFEANPQAFQFLCANVTADEASNVTLYPVAVSDSVMILRMRADEMNAAVPRPGIQCNFLAQSARLDEVLNGQRVDMLKIDVEGHEPAALRGMEELIRQHRPALITEFHPWALDVTGQGGPTAYLNQLKSYGYAIRIILHSGELSDADALEYWRSLKDEMAHLDLFGVI